MDEKKSIIDMIEHHIQKRNDYPILNPQAIKIQQEITRDEPDFQNITRIARQDPTLTSEILKAANSAYYKGLQPIETIKEAIVRLGKDAITQTIMHSLIKNRFMSTHPQIRPFQKQIWNHAVLCAAGAAWTARHLSIAAMTSKAPIAGLLHDIGKLFILSAIEAIIIQKEVESELPGDLIKSILDRFHAQEGYALLSNWGLPESYCIIARDHHVETMDPSNTLLSMVRLVNMVCRKIEAGANQDLSFILSIPETDTLGISDTGLAELEIFMEDMNQEL